LVWKAATCHLTVDEAITDFTEASEADFHKFDILYSDGQLVTDGFAFNGDVDSVKSFNPADDALVGFTMAAGSEESMLRAL